MTFLLGLTLFGVLIIIVGNSIVKLFFIDPEESKSEPSLRNPSRDMILSSMVKRNWITQEKAHEIEIMSEKDIIEKFKNV